MRDQQTGVMEKDILSAENSLEQPSPEKENFSPDILNKIQKILDKVVGFLTNIVSIFKNKKALIIMAIIILIGAIFLGLVSLSNKPAYQQPIVTNNPVADPPRPSAQPELQKIKGEVDAYTLELELLETDFDNLQAPEIDLDIDF